MFALIVSSDGKDEVFVSCSQSKLESRAFKIIEENIDIFNEDNEFGKSEQEKLLLQSMSIKDVESSLELFADVSELRGDMVYMRIAYVTLEMDA